MHAFLTCLRKSLSSLTRVCFIADDVTDEQLKQIAEELLALDYNNAAEFVTVNDHDASP